MVGADAGHGAVLDGVDQRGHVVRLADGRVDAVGQAAVVKPQVVRRDLAADPRTAHPAHADGIDGFPGGDVAHVQPGAVVLGQMAVAHSLDVLGQAVVPGLISRSSAWDMMVRPRSVAIANARAMTALFMTPLPSSVMNLMSSGRVSR